MNQAVGLQQLASPFPLKALTSKGDVPCLGITSDSRRVHRGDVFVAIRGSSLDGHRYLHQAVENGAAGLVVEEGGSWTRDGLGKIPIFTCSRTRQFLGQAVRSLKGKPDQRLEVVAVTGTNGKTTVADILHQFFEMQGRKAGLLGTIRYETGRREVEARWTTPPVEEFYGYLEEMVQSDQDLCVMEASSHALHQHRLGPAEVDVAAYSNITREHLEYHRDLEDYLQAKLLLLQHLEGAQRTKRPGRAVVNLDDSTFASVPWPRSTLFVGRSEDAHLRLRESRTALDGIHMELEIDGRHIEFSSPLLGAFNVENLLLAAGVARALGYGEDSISESFSRLRPVKGRLEKVAIEGGPLVLVDYAHTPDGIRSALVACRGMTQGKLVMIFGCGGDRDRGKRLLMARAAVEGADEVILTLDNPRTEDPEQIFADTRKGFSGAEQRSRTIGDRSEAIAEGLHRAGPGDILLIAGKGHEDYQILGTEKVPWDDRKIIRDLWQQIEGSHS